MRLYSRVGPYHGRAPQAATRSTGGGAALRRPSKAEAKIEYWSPPRSADTPRGGRGDTTGWLRGSSDSPYSAAHVPSKKK